MRLSSNEYREWFDVCAIPNVLTTRASAKAIQPAYDKAWLTTPVPILTVTGGAEHERTAAVAELAKYWIFESVLFALPDNLWFYMTEAVPGMQRYRAALNRHDPRYDDFDVVMQECKYLTVTEIGDLSQGEDVNFGALLRQRRNKNKLTVVTFGDGDNVSDKIMDTLATGHIITLED